MRQYRRFATFLVVLLLAFAATSPALALQAGDAASARAQKVSLASVWEWVAGLLLPHFDAARGAIIPDGETGDPEPPPAENPAAPTPEMPSDLDATSL